MRVMPRSAKNSLPSLLVDFDKFRQSAADFAIHEPALRREQPANEIAWVLDDAAGWAHAGLRSDTMTHKSSKKTVMFSTLQYEADQQDRAVMPRKLAEPHLSKSLAQYGLFQAVCVTWLHDHSN